MRTFWMTCLNTVTLEYFHLRQLDVALIPLILTISIFLTAANVNITFFRRLLALFLMPLHKECQIFRFKIKQLTGRSFRPVHIQWPMESRQSSKSNLYGTDEVFLVPPRSQPNSISLERKSTVQNTVSFIFLFCILEVSASNWWIIKNFSY